MYLDGNRQFDIDHHEGGGDPGHWIPANETPRSGRRYRGRPSHDLYPGYNRLFLLICLAVLAVIILSIILGDITTSNSSDPVYDLPEKYEGQFPKEMRKFSPD